MNMYKQTSEIKKKPKLYLKRIKFNDNTELQLDKNSIIVFTEPIIVEKSNIERYRIMFQ